MNNVRSLQQQVERALAFADEVLEHASERRIFEAVMYAESVLPRFAQIQPAQLGDARQLVDRVRQLRAVVTVLEQRINTPRANASN